MSDTPPAVPLNICLSSIYNVQGQTDLEVDIAVKILQTIINNNGLEKFRSLNVNKVFSRIVNPTNLALWYVLRHAGFYKDGDRIICPITVELEIIKGVLEQLIQVIDRNAKIRSGEITIQKYTGPTSPPANTSRSNNSSHQTMNDDDAAQQSQQHQQSQQQQQVTMNDTPTTVSPLVSPPTSHTATAVEATSPITPASPTTPTTPASQPISPASQTTATSPSQGTTKPSVGKMTAEERKAYVAELMAKKKAAKNQS